MKIAKKVKVKDLKRLGFEKGSFADYGLELDNGAVMQGRINSDGSFNLNIDAAFEMDEVEEVVKLLKKFKLSDV